VNILMTVVLTLQIVSAIAMIGLILVQHGKGADAGAAFGSGGSGSASLFGASGSANFLSRSTAVLATIFLTSTLMLASFGGNRPASTGSVLEGVAVPTGTQGAPADPAANAVPATGAAQIPGK
jgi:preprotein translocase subunit SecG